MSERTARLDQLLREEISRLLARDVADPRIGFVTVTDVDVAPDLSHATVWVSVIGDEATRRRSLRALGRAMPWVRHQLGDLRLKKIPELHVRADDSAERGTRVLQLLQEIEGGSGSELPDLPAPVTPRGLPEPPGPRTRTSGSGRSGHGARTRHGAGRTSCRKSRRDR
jgi:ribosome-binding factor A